MAFSGGVRGTTFAIGVAVTTVSGDFSGMALSGGIMGTMVSRTSRGSGSVSRMTVSGGFSWKSHGNDLISRHPGGVCLNQCLEDLWYLGLFGDLEGYRGQLYLGASRVRLSLQPSMALARSVLKYQPI